jgi:hypothetical protein
MHVSWAQQVWALRKIGATVAPPRGPILVQA